jgi:hypothetical protein
MNAVRLGVTRNQRDLWAAEWRTTDRRMHTVAQHIEIRGSLDLTAFEDAAQHVVAETEALRARFREYNGEVVQEILPAVRWRLAVVELSGHADPATSADEWAAAEQRQPILASDFPLFSTALLRLGVDHYRWYLRFHHLAMDAFSAALLLHRVAAVYAARSLGGDPGPSPFQPISALHDELRRYEESERFAADRDFWRRQLAQLPPPVRMTPDNPAGSQVLVGAGLAPPAPTQIRDTAAKADTAWPDVVLAVVAARAAAECDARRIVLTVPVSNRTTALTRSVPTNMANRIMLAVTVEPQASFLELLKAVAADNRQAVRHQIFPHSVVMADLGGRAEPHRAAGPWVNIMPFGADLVLPGCTSAVHRTQTGPVHDMEVAVYGDPDASRMRVNVMMRLRPEGREQLFTRERHLMDLFAAVTADPHRPLSDLLTARAVSR